MLIFFLVLLQVLSLAVASALPGSHAENSLRLIAKARSLLRREGEEGSTSIDWSSTPVLAGVIGGSVFVVLAGYIGYRYATWVPRTRPARGKGSGAETPTSPSSNDERLKLLVNGTKK